MFKMTAMGSAVTGDAGCVGKLAYQPAGVSGGAYLTVAEGRPGLLPGI